MDMQQERLFTPRQLRLLVLPLIVELALKLVVGMVDSVMVASAGEAAVSGVSLVDTVMQLVIYVFAAMASGGAVVAGQYLGSGNGERARRAADELMWLNMALSLVIMLAVLLASRWIVGSLFGQIEAQVAYHASGYLFYVALSIPAIAIFEAGTAIYRTMGNAKITMKISLLMNAINCAGNAVLIYGLSMGAAGAAIATLVARWVAAIIVVGLLLNQKLELHLFKTLRHRFDLALSRQIMSVGVPGGVENGVFQLGKIALLGLTATFGTSAITANAITQTLASIQVIPGSAIQLAMVTVIARCVGAQDYAQARYYNRKLLLTAYLSLIVLSAALYLCLPGILSLYGLSQATAQLTGDMFLWHTLGAALLWPLAFDLPASLRAAGDVKFPMLISILSMWAFRFGGAYLLAYPLGMGAVGVWAAMALLDWGFRAVIYCLRWRGGKWQRMRVI